MKKIRKILVINTAFLGDVILFSPLIRSLDQTYPKAEIHILVIPQNKILLKYNRHLDKILLFDKRKKLNKLFSFIRLLFQLKRENYDLAFSSTRSLTNSLFMFLSRIPDRIGFERQKLLTKSVKVISNTSACERYLSLIKPFSSNLFDNQTEIFWSDTESEKAKKIISKYQRINGVKLIGIAPGSIRKTKRWPKEYFIELINLTNSLNIKIFLIGGKEEHSLCDFINKSSGNQNINLAGELSILESAALISKLDLVISNDSAALHIANAVMTTVIGIFGPTVKEFGFFPFRDADIVHEIKDLNCRPCSRHGGNKCPLNHFKCMMDISPEQVFNSMTQILTESKEK